MKLVSEQSYRQKHWRIKMNKIYVILLTRILENETIRRVQHETTTNKNAKNAYAKWLDEASQVRPCSADYGEQTALDQGQRPEDKILTIRSLLCHWQNACCIVYQIQ